MGTQWNCLDEAILTSIHYLCMVQKRENITDFQLKNSFPRAMKTSNLLDRYVILMVRNIQNRSLRPFRAVLKVVDIMEYQCTSSHAYQNFFAMVNTIKFRENRE